MMQLVFMFQGLLGAGYEKYGKKEEMDKDPLKYLLQVS